MLKLHLDHIDTLDKAIAHIEAEVGLGLEPIRQAAKLLSTMPGLSSVSAHVVVAEIGIDMSRLATPGHLLSWACLCPHNDESAGKRRSTRLRHGGKWLKTTLVQAEWAAIKVKGSYLQAQFHRLRARRGAKKAIIGVAASMLTAAWRGLSGLTTDVAFQVCESRPRRYRAESRFRSSRRGSGWRISPSAARSCSPEAVAGHQPLLAKDEGIDVVLGGGGGQRLGIAFVHDPRCWGPRRPRSLRSRAGHSPPCRSLGTWHCRTAAHRPATRRTLR
jgi:Transposase IS116/IS110/IS902 family